MNTSQTTALRSYIQLFEQLQPHDLEQFDAIFAADARFKDPFNDVRGVAGIRALFEHMFEQVESPRFHVLHHAVEGQIAYLHWHFDCVTRKGVDYRIDGLSEVRFNAEGQVVSHIDYWDAAEQFYMRIPLLGNLLRWIARRVSAS